MSGDGLLTLAAVAAATGARIHPATPAEKLAATVIRAVSTDTRTLQAGDLFVALPGPRADGHRFISDALARGAVAVVAATLPDEALLMRAPVLLVENTLAALGAIGARHRQGLRAEVVGITGSVGKTTVTQLTAAILARQFRVVASEESWNAEIGVPLTLLRATVDTEVIVTEMAMRGLGQIAELVAIARPQIGVVTNVGESHLGLLGTVERVAQAKGELIAGLPADGVAVLNADDPWTDRLARRAPGRVVRFGLAGAADVRAEEPRVAGRGMEFRLMLGRETAPVRLPLPGTHNVLNALAAAAVGLVMGVPVDVVRAALEGARAAAHRLQVEEVGSLLILDDSYNASPRSVRAALEVLDEVAGPRRRVLVLGDMKELGAASARLHRETGQEAARRNAALLIAVGPEAAALAEGARGVLGSGRVVHVPDRDGAAAALAGVILPGDAVLVKGSRAMGLEVVVESLRTSAAAKG